MTNIDVKTVGELFESVGPTEEHRQKLGQTLRGSLLGQAVAAAYLVECSRCFAENQGPLYQLARRRFSQWEHLRKVAESRFEAGDRRLDQK